MISTEENEYGPECCPNCGSADIVGGHVEFGLARLDQDIECEQCGAKWQDVFEYVGITGLEVPNA